MIVESLTGKRILITGATGFLGTALVERLLRCIPDCELVLIIRPGRRGADWRLQRDVLRSDAFNRLRSSDAFNESGNVTPQETFTQMARRRIHAVAGDVSVDGLNVNDAGRSLIAGCDIVIHAAAAVSFNSALDDAVEINLLGPVRLAAFLNDIKAHPHLIAVSTCYVAGSRRGAASEELVNDSPFFVNVNWRNEVECARQARTDAEQKSRKPEQLSHFATQARREIGAAGRPAIANKTESLRRQWVKKTMIKAGKARANSLGFPDAYAFTKALGEQALTETCGTLNVSFVRPSIIESALKDPHPGWIQGFRMAEPVIAAYARGMLKEFPGVPEGIVDVIPVDIVVSAILAVAACGTDDFTHEIAADQSGVTSAGLDGSARKPGLDGSARKPKVVQVASGAINPLKYGQLVDLVRKWFIANPVHDERNQPISVPKWSFPGRGRVTKQLHQATRSLEAADKILTAMPLRGRYADMCSTMEERRKQLEQAKDYVELYGAYAECDAIYQVDRLLELWNLMDEQDRAQFCFHPASVAWQHYVSEVHLPSMVNQARLKMAPGRGVSESRSVRLRRQVTDQRRHMAVFDLENTLIASNVVASYSWLATCNLRGLDRFLFTVKTIGEIPWLLMIDSKDRSDFLRYFYRRFEGASVEQIRSDCKEMFSDMMLAKSFPEGIRRVREHRQAGHTTVMITGALDFVVEPMLPLFDHVVTSKMSHTNGVYDGQLISVPPTGETRHQILADFAAEHGYDLRECVAYADSASDLPMLEAVGFPVAVNPETKLAAMARRRGWLIENWSTGQGAPSKLLPISPQRYR